MTLPIAVE